MTIVRFDPRRPGESRKPPKPRFDIETVALAVVALVAVCVLGWVSADQYLPGGGDIATLTSPAPVAAERRVSFSMCGRYRYTCVVDGDTIWFDGKNVRLQSYDTPEPYNDICGGPAEVALAHRASARLLQLLNSNAFAVDFTGTDRYGRTLATIRIGGRDVGDILIEEGLARRWPDGPEFWC